MSRLKITLLSRAACDAILKLVASDAAKCGYLFLGGFFLLLLSLSPAVAAGPMDRTVDMPQGNPIDPILVSAQAANRWQQGSYDVWLLRGSPQLPCHLSQGPDTIDCQEAVLWIDRTMVEQDGNTKVIAYLEGTRAQPVVLTLQRGGKPVKIVDQNWFGRLFTVRDVRVQVPVVAAKPDVLPPIFQRGMDTWNPAPLDSLRHVPVQQAQYLVPQNELAPTGQATVPESVAAPAPTTPPGTRRFRFFPRGDVPVQGSKLPEPPQSNQHTFVIEQGAKLVVDGIMQQGNPATPGLGAGPQKIEVNADRLVIWYGADQNSDIGNGAAAQKGLVQDERRPLEVYMEGNVIFLDNDRTIYADKMYYDFRNNVGTVLSADVLSPAPGYDGLLRLHADVIQITGKDHFRGQNAFATSSRLGVPRYSLHAGEVTLDDIQTPKVDPLTGQPLMRPGTNEQLFDHRQHLTTTDDVLYIEQVPIFYWPYMATDLDESSFLLRRVQFKQDTVFGTQFQADLNGYQLFGITDRPRGTDWDVTLGYLSLRGFAEGTSFKYKEDNFVGFGGPMQGLFDFYGINDRGTDNLGGGRGSVMPEPDVDYRYRILFQHRQDLGEGFQFTAEAGIISDRNFLQEYFNSEWNELKDQSTDVELRWQQDAISASVMAGVRTDPFFTETQWLPKGDLNILGESLAADRLTLFDHTSIGYAQFKNASLPSAAAGDEAVSHLPWEANNRQGARAVTRNEFDLPVELGVVKVVPYVLGEVGYWGEDINGNQLTRGYYQAGVRATLPLWAADSTIESTLWNVHGLANKIEFDAEYLHAQSTKSVTDLPLYDQIDDNQIEDFRRRFVVNTFGLPVVAPPGSQGPPMKFDERFYAVRTDMEGWIEAPSMEIADDLDEVRLGMHDRWQTKRGMPDDRHIVDYIDFDTNITLYPDANRDNFGSIAGLIDYNFVWHIGDRTTVVSDGIFDTFGQGQKIVDVGFYLARPPRGNLYAGVRVLQGPINDTVLAGSYSYWMSPKWISAVGTSVDLVNTKNFGESIHITRVGESLLVGADFTYNPALNSFSAGLTIEPRFIKNSGKLGQATGTQLPPAGAFGVD